MHTMLFSIPAIFIFSIIKSSLILGFVNINECCINKRLKIICCCYHFRREIIILKLYFEKAFDKVEHELMVKIMESMGFLEKWLTWMTLIINSGTSTVLLNGVLGKVFHYKPGSDKGNPCPHFSLLW